MIVTKLLLNWATIVLSGAAGIGATVTTGAADMAGLSAVAIAAACAGSASAILFLILDRTDRPPERIFRRVFHVMVAFALGAAFGLFVGPSIADVSPLDRIAGIYIGGLTGFGIIGVLVSPKTMKALGQWLVSVLTNRGGGS